MWRGPHGNGQSDEIDVPTRWSGSENVAWQVSIPGTGHSSPVVSGERIFLTTALEAENRRVLICLNRADGRALWQQDVIKAPLEHKNKLNSYASATPAADGRHVFVSFFGQPEIVIVCYDFAGKEIWRKVPGTFSSVHGFCSSPVLYKDTVILNCDQDAAPDAQAFIVALDREDGREKWRIDRPNRTRSYVTPMIADLAGRTQMLLSGSKSVTSYDPDTGKPFWIVAGPTEQMVASLVTTDGAVFVTGGFPEHHLLGIDPSGSGDVTASHILWHERRPVSYVPSPIAHGHWFYVVADDGQCGCFEARTGQLMWKQRLGLHHSASAVSAGDNLYFTSDAGETFVLKGTDKFDLVSRNDLGEDVRASPAISHGQIFIRTIGHLFCIGKAGS
jgi:outer membrane protein assembly factor BamB